MRVEARAQPLAELAGHRRGGQGDRALALRRRAPRAARAATAPDRPGRARGRDLRCRLARRCRGRARAGELAARSAPGAGVAARGARPRRGSAALELPEGIGADALADVAAARERASRSRSPGPLANPAVLELLGARELFSASTLEAYDNCSYIWFANTELRPEPIGPDPEPLETGGIIHAALEALYRDPPGGPRPTPADVGEWIEAGRRRLREAARERQWDPEGAAARISFARLDAVLARWLRRDAETGGPMAPRPELLEVGFGLGPDDERDAAEIGSFRLRGRIDRIDVSADGKALIRDYKLSSKAIAAKKLLEEGKLQMPLYIAAVRGMGMEPIGGVYHPLNATKERDDRPRGLLTSEHRDVLIPGDTDAHVGTDFLTDEVFDETIVAAVEQADGIVAGIRAGRIGRDPRGGECPTWCRLAPICRKERGVVDPDEEEEEEAAA